MKNVSWNQNVIKIKGRNITLEYDILEVKELNHWVLIVTKPERGVLDNLYGISMEMGEMWKAQKLSEVYPGFSQTPYVGVCIIGNEVLVTDFCGCRFVVDLMSGEIKGRAGETK